jgi:predicted regulator of Ras-like GTPase activity (Roadblock/LC7/MglB family)
MGLSIRDVRQIVLVTLIVAILPMLVYPNSLGLDFNLNLVWYLCLELIYFWAIAAFVFRWKSAIGSVGVALLYLVGRMLLSTTLVLFLLVLERTTFAAALGYAFSDFKPALLLYSLAAPFLYNSTIKVMFVDSPLKTEIRRSTTLALHPATPGRITGKIISRLETAVPATTPPRNPGEYLNRTFDDAVRHIGGYSGVLCAMLIDGEGLPVAGWNRGEYDQELWGAFAKKMTEDLEETSLRAGSSRLENLEFKSGDQRVSLVRVADMWLLAIADAASDELEKIRMHQAAEMIVRHCQEKFGNIYTTETGRKYAGSTF